jgi:hypothetical protein
MDFRIPHQLYSKDHGSHCPGYACLKFRKENDEVSFSLKRNSSGYSY